MAWQNIKERIKTPAKEILGLYELKQRKAWFDEECLGFLAQRKEAKMQWIEDPSQNNIGNLKNRRREAIRYFRDKNEEIYGS